MPELQVSAIVPARNEEANIAGAVESLAAQTVPLEIIVVNDASNDGTGSILAELQQRLPQLKVVETGELPPGWTGKNYAVACGVAQARAPWLLLTDADVRHAPNGGEARPAAAGAGGAGPGGGRRHGQLLARPGAADLVGAGHDSLRLLPLEQRVPLRAGERPGRLGGGGERRMAARLPHRLRRRGRARGGQRRNARRRGAGAALEALRLPPALRPRGQSGPQPDVLEPGRNVGGLVEEPFPALRPAQGHGGERGGGRGAGYAGVAVLAGGDLGSVAGLAGGSLAGYLPGRRDRLAAPALRPGAAAQPLSALLAALLHPGERALRRADAALGAQVPGRRAGALEGPRLPGSRQVRFFKENADEDATA